MLFSTRHSLRTSLAVTIASFAVFLSAVSHAETIGTVPRVKVSYSDLDLGDMDDAERLYQRLRAAAGTACRQFDGRELHKLALRQQCEADALQRAVMDVNAPSIFALHGQRQDVKVAEKTSQSTPRG
jgi:UrcA family protein